MLISALYGIKILKILNYFAVPVLVLVCLYGLVASLRNNGWAAVSQYTLKQQEALCQVFQ